MSDEEDFEIVIAELRRSTEQIESAGEIGRMTSAMLITIQGALKAGEHSFPFLYRMMAAFARSEHDRIERELGEE